MDLAEPRSTKDLRATCHIKYLIILEAVQWLSRGKSHQAGIVILPSFVAFLEYLSRTNIPFMLDYASK